MSKEVKDLIRRKHKDYPGYEITSCGRVFSTDFNWRGYGEREMNQCKDRYGYLKVRLTIQGRRKKLAVHKLVALCFLRKSKKGLQIRHLDGNKENNHFTNLKWGTALENAQDRTRHGTASCGRSASVAIKNGMAKSTNKHYIHARNN